MPPSTPTTSPRKKTTTRSKPSKHRQDGDHHPDPRRKGSVEKGADSVHKENESRIGKDIIDEVYKETGFKP